MHTHVIWCMWGMFVAKCYTHKHVYYCTESRQVLTSLNNPQIIPWRACAARVTVVGFVCVSVRMSVRVSVCVFVCVCLLSHISLLERLFTLKLMSRTQRATKVKIFVRFSFKPLCCRDPALPSLYGYLRSAILLRWKRACALFDHVSCFIACVYHVQLV